MQGAQAGDITPIDLRVERVRQGLNQTELAALAGIDQPTVSLVENGKARPEHVDAVARALGMVE